MNQLTRLGRPLAGGTAVALLATLTTMGAGAAQAADSPLPGVRLPVKVTDVTDSDTNLAKTSNEVVVVHEGDDGPEVLKLRTNSAADAARLEARLESVPGVTVGENKVYTVPAVLSPDQSPKISAEERSGFDAQGQPVGKNAAKITDEPRGSNQWGLYATGAEQAWTRTRGAGITVAVIDSGVDATHQDLKDRTLAQVNLVPGPAGDLNGHGTHVAGVVAASLNGAGVAGLANQASILPIRVLNASGAGDTRTVTQGIYAAIERGATVISLSLGGFTSDPVLKQAVAFAIARGVTVVAAAGNNGSVNRPFYPAAYPGVIGVGSVGLNVTHSDFSNAGTFVDISGPGEDIYSTYLGGSYAYMNGTSMATPFVAATAALARAANPTLTGQQIQSVLLTTAQDDPKKNGRDNQFGYGLVRADQAARKAATLPGGINGPQVRATVVATRTGYGNVLHVNVNPDKQVGVFTFRLQKLVNGAWTTLPAFHRTAGAAQTKSISLPRGTYRVLVPAGGGFSAAVSRAVAITPKTAKVSVKANKSRSKFTVDVNPNKGSGFWVVRVQKLTGGKWVTQKKSYKTKGAAETVTINLKKGTYRVVVPAKYGYQQGVSGRVALAK